MTVAAYSPRIYVADLASYNNGVLHGVWIDLDGKDADDVHEEIRAKVLRTSKFPNVMVDCPDCEGPLDDEDIEEQKIYGTLCQTCKGSGKVPSSEEFAIHDYEGFGRMKVDEYDSIERLVFHAAMIEKHGDAWSIYVDWGTTDEPTEEDFQDRYIGEMSAEDYVEEFTRDCYGELPKHLEYYINWESMARDWKINGEIYESDGHLFRGY